MKFDESVFEYFVLGVLAMLLSLVLSSLTPYDVIARVLWIAGVITIVTVFLLALALRVRSWFRPKTQE